MNLLVLNFLSTSRCTNADRRLQEQEGHRDQLGRGGPALLLELDTSVQRQLWRVDTVREPRIRIAKRGLSLFIDLE